MVSLLHNRQYFHFELNKRLNGYSKKVEYYFMIAFFHCHWSFHTKSRKENSNPRHRKVANLQHANKMVDEIRLVENYFMVSISYKEHII
jgi:hypothetical protein